MSAEEIIQCDACPVLRNEQVFGTSRRRYTMGLSKAAKP